MCQIKGLPASFMLLFLGLMFVWSAVEQDIESYIEYFKVV